jgi:hypothetical protein
MMKNLFVIAAFLFTASFCQAQLKAKAVCPTLEADVMAGHVNELYPKSAIAEIKNALPCFTDVIETDSASRCAGVFYKDKGLSFFTERKYIEIGEQFRGKLSPALMGVSRSSLFKLLGLPKLKDTDWDAFQMGYGTLILYYNKAGRINRIQVSSKTTDTIKLCE